MAESSARGDREAHRAGERDRRFERHQPHRLVSTCTTSYNGRYSVARRFSPSTISAAPLESSSQAEDEAVNFVRRAFRTRHRYDRASEFYDVVAGLWDSWEDDAFLKDKKSGVWFDFDKMHILHHKGEHFNVRGPLNVARSPQGRPVVSQAGSSDVGMELAARTADMVFTAQDVIAESRAFCDDMKGRLDKYGRGPEDARIFPGIMPIVGRTQAEAQEKYEELRDLVDDGVGIAGVARLAGGVDIHSLDPDGPLRRSANNAARAPGERIIAMGKRGMTIRQIGRVLAMSQSHRVVPGRAEVDRRRSAGMAGGRRLRRLQPAVRALSQAAREWVDMVVPELQRRGLFRTEYEGKTFRENLACRCRRTGSPRNQRERSGFRPRPSNDPSARCGSAASSACRDHLAGWRHPDAVTDADMDFRQYAHITQVARRRNSTIFFPGIMSAFRAAARLARGEHTRAKLSRTVKAGRDAGALRW